MSDGQAGLIHEVWCIYIGRPNSQCPSSFSLCFRCTPPSPWPHLGSDFLLDVIQPPPVQLVHVCDEACEHLPFIMDIIPGRSTAGRSMQCTIHHLERTVLQPRNQHTCPCALLALLTGPVSLQAGERCCLGVRRSAFEGIVMTI